MFIHLVELSRTRKTASHTCQKDGEMNPPATYIHRRFIAVCFHTWANAQLPRRKEEQRRQTAIANRRKLSFGVVVGGGWLRERTSRASPQRTHVRVQRAGRARGGSRP